MRVKSVITVPGKGKVTIVDDILEQRMRVGDILTDGKCEWRVQSAEITGPRRIHDEVGLLLRGVNGTDWESHPDPNTELTIKPKPLGEMTLGELTVDQAIDIFARQSKERQELAEILKDLHHAINVLELGIAHEFDGRMAKFKDLREIFNRIPPKWFHR